MHRGAVTCFFVALLLAAPHASARSNASLVLTPERRVFTFEAHEARDIPVDVTLRLSDFICFQQAWFVVHLSVHAGEGVAARFSEARVGFPVDARSYVGATFEATQEIVLQVHIVGAGADRLVGLVAKLEPDREACVAPGGFDEAIGRADLRFDVVRSADGSTFAGGSDIHEDARHPNATLLPPRPSQPPLTARAVFTLLGLIVAAVILRKV